MNQELPPQRIEYTLCLGEMEAKLLQYQNPRGIRNGARRVTKIKMDIHAEFDFIELKKHIEYLCELHATMEIPKKLIK